MKKITRRSQHATKIDKRLNYGFVFAIFGLIANGFFLQKGISEIIKASELRAQSQQAANEMRLLVSLINEAETGQRGYLLTGKDEYLKPYTNALGLIIKTESQIKELLSADKIQTDRLLQLSKIIDEKLASLAKTISLKRTKGSEAARKFLLTGVGRKQMDEIRDLSGLIKDRQKGLVSDYTEQIGKINTLGQSITLAGSSVAIILVAAFLWLLGRNQKRRFLAEQSLLQLNKELEDHKNVLSEVITFQNNMATVDLDSNRILDVVVEQSLKLTRSSGASIEIPDGNEMVYQHVSGEAAAFKGARISTTGCFSYLSLQEKSVLVCNDTESDQRVTLSLCRKANIRSMIVLPLQFGGKIVGVLKNYSSEPNHFTAQRVDALKLVVGNLAATLGQAAEFAQKFTVIQALEKTKEELIQSRDIAEAATKTKSSFLAVMSHEFRTPLNGILGMSSLLLDSNLNSVQEEYARTVKVSGESLLRLVNDVLDFSKIEAGKLDFEIVNFDLVSTLQDVEKSFAFAARQKDITIETDIGKSIPPYVKGDPGRIRQILINLISNAIKFTPSGFVKIQVDSHFQNHELVDLRFEIQDSGIGISSSVITNLFQQFTQADISTTRRFGGTGLGLSICKGLVEQMSGQIGVTSVEGFGSKFWFTISLGIGREASTSLENTDTLTDFSGTGATWRILIADDNQVNQTVALRMLEKMGLRGDVAANGKEVIEALQNRTYDIVLMDCHMPEMDGFEATKFIRNSGTITNTKIPIIAMTANAMKGDQDRCLAAGMDDYLTKPVSFPKLKELMHKWTEVVTARTTKSA